MRTVNKKDFEDQIALFWDECDVWANARLEEIYAQGFEISEDDIIKIENKVEEEIYTFLEKGFITHGESFEPGILVELHHLFFELELKKYGIPNQEYIHCYKENGQVAIATVEGQIKPTNALFLMEINRAHFEKKSGNDENVCEDCICGKK